jgi:small subunit ribosomal protein S17
MAASTAKTDKRKLRKTRIGVVTSAHKTPKTIRVEVQYQVKHPLYEKIVRRTQRLHAHDEKAEAKLGDRVEIMECRPISKTKTWRLVKVLESA